MVRQFLSQCDIKPWLTMFGNDWQWFTMNDIINQVNNKPKELLL